MTNLGNGFNAFPIFYFYYSILSFHSLYFNLVYSSPLLNVTNDITTVAFLLFVLIKQRLKPSVVSLTTTTTTTATHPNKNANPFSLHHNYNHHHYLQSSSKFTSLLNVPCNPPLGPFSSSYLLFSFSSFFRCLGNHDKPSFLVPTLALPSLDLAFFSLHRRLCNRSKYPL